MTVGLDAERRWPAIAVAVPNPHAVVFVDDVIGPAEPMDPADDGGEVHAEAGGADQHGRMGPATVLARLGVLTEPPTLSPDGVFPDGANVEFVTVAGERHIALRVWERGVGETRSCGTGVCAAAWAAMRRDDATGGHLASAAASFSGSTTYTVDVPGGRLRVTRRADGELLLTGPAVLGVRGTVAL